MDRYFTALLSREQCVKVDGVMIKDLRVIRNRSVANMIIVDN